MGGFALLSFETLNLVWSKEFIQIAWHDEDFEMDGEEKSAKSINWSASKSGGTNANEKAGNENGPTANLDDTNVAVSNAEDKA